MNWLELRNLEFSQIRTSKSTRSWPKVKKPEIIQSPIRIWIPTRTLVGISTITFDSIIRLRWFKLGWKSDMMGYKYDWMTISKFECLEGRYGPAIRAKNQSEFRDFHEVYLISKTLMHSHEVQNVGRFILGLLYK